MRKYQSFKEFYPFYLTEHQHPTSRVLHFVGTALFFAALIGSVVVQWWWGLILCPVLGYGFAWVGHFFFEKNQPATFQYPAWSLISDFKLFFQILAGKQRFRP